MSQRTWEGGAAAVAQVWAGSVTDATAGHTYTLTFTDEAGGTVTLTYTVQGGDTTTTIATNIAALVTASVDPRVKAVTAASATNQVTLTARSAGAPFYVATGGTGTWTGTGNTTVNQGPSDWNTIANWVENAVPVGGDNVTLTGNSDILYGLQTGLTLGAFSALGTFSGKAGGPGLYLKFIATSFYWAGSGVAYIDLSTSAISPRIVTTNSQSAPNYGLYLLGSALTTVIQEAGSVGFAAVDGRTATAATYQLQGTQGRCRIGGGVTLTNFNMDGGTAELACAAAAVTAEGGTLTTVGTGAITTLNNNGATCYPNSAGTITNLNCNGGTTDMTQTQVARTVTTPKVGRGATLKYDPANVTMTTPPAPVTGTGPVTVQVS